MITRPIFISILLFSIPLINCGGDNGDFPQQSPTLGVSKKKIRSLAEITDDLEKVTLASLLVDSDQDPLGNIAYDLKKTLPKPLGEFSSRLILLNKRLITVYKDGLDTKNWENVLVKIFKETLQLKREVNEVASTIVDVEDDELVFLNGLSKAAEKTQLKTQELDKEFREIIEHNELLKNNRRLASEQEELKQKIKRASDLLIATKLMYQLVRKFSGDGVLKNTHAPFFISKG